MIQIPRRVIDRTLFHHGLDLSPSQLRAVYCPARVVDVAGGGQAGKSWVAAAYALTRMPLCRLVWVIGPDFSQARKELSYLADWVGAKGGVEAYRTPDDGSRTLLTTYGCLVRTMSADNIMSIATEAPDGILIVEAAQTSRECYERARERVGPNQGWVFLSGTFEDEKPWYDELFAELETEGCAFSLPSWENKSKYPGGFKWDCKHYDENGNQVCKCNSEILLLKNVLGDKRFRKRIAGQRVASDVIVYDIYSQSMVKVPPPDNELKMVVAGVDYGFGDPTVVEVFGLNSLKWWGLDEFYAPKYTAHRLKDKFDEMRRRWNIQAFFIPHDKPEIVAEYHELCDLENPPRPYRDRCKFIQNGDFKNVRSGIGWVYSLMETGRISFSPLQVYLQDEAKTYAYPDRESRNKGENPVDLNNHASDALRLAMMGVKDNYEKELFRAPDRRLTEMSDVERIAFMRRRAGAFPAMAGAGTRDNF